MYFKTWYFTRLHCNYKVAAVQTGISFFGRFVQNLDIKLQNWSWKNRPKKEGGSHFTCQAIRTSTDYGHMKIVHVGTLFGNVILGWYQEILGRQFVIVYFFNWQTGKKTCFGPIRSIITNFCPNITSKNIVPATWKGLWLLDPNFSTAQIHIPIPNRKFCKMYKKC